MRTDKDLYDAIIHLYGHSHLSQLELASKLEVSYNTARHLTVECGYYRHRLVNPAAVSLREFTVKPYATYVIRSKGLSIISRPQT